MRSKSKSEFLSFSQLARVVIKFLKKIKRHIFKIIQAECKVLHRKPVCICPPGYTGRATEACYPSHYFFSSRSGIPSGADTESDLVELETTTIPGKVKFEDEIDIVKDQENESFKLSLPVEDDQETTQASSSSVKFTR